MSDNHKKETEGLAWRRVLGICSIMLACGVPLLHLPAQIYAGSTQDFNYSFGTDLAAVAAVIAAIPVLLAIPLFLPWRRLVRGWAQAWFVIAILVWVSGYLLVLKMRPLDGRTVDLRIPLSFAILSTIALLFIGFVALLVAIRTPRAAVAPVLLLNLAAFGITISRVSSAPKPTVRAPIPGQERLMRFSRSGNVLLIILDEFQSDIFESILSREPRLNKALDGFLFFPDTVGPATSTLLALPPIHSGKPYDGQRPMSRIYEEDVRSGSFLAALARSGYETATVATIAVKRPPEGALSMTTAELVAKSIVSNARSEYERLIDVALLRVAPAPLKRSVFNNGAGVLQALDLQGNQVNPASAGIRVLDMMAHDLNATAQMPTAKLLHLMISHPPVYLGADCRPLPEPARVDRVGMSAQCLCGIEAVLRVLDRMKRADVYDNTSVFVFGDHGAGYYRLPSAPDKRLDEAAWRSSVGITNPLLLWKPKGQHGPLRIDHHMVQLSDIATTVCEETHSCSGFPGTPLDQEHPRTPRPVVDYEWKNELWTADTIPGLRWYSVDGPIASPTSWRRLNPPQLTLGKWLEFGGRPDARAYLDWGWSGIEPWGVWSDAHISSISLSLAAPPTRPLRFDIRLRPYVVPEHPRIMVTVFANTTQVATWTLQVPQRDLEMSVDLPVSVWSGNRSISLLFDINSPTSPAALGLRGKDSRLLGIGLEAIMLQ